MNFLACVGRKKSSKTVSRLSTTHSTLAQTRLDNAANEIDYSPVIQQQADTARLRKNVRSMNEVESQRVRSQADRADRDLVELKTTRNRLENRMGRTQNELRKDSLSDEEKIEMKRREALGNSQLKKLKTDIATQKGIHRLAHEIYHNEAEKISRQGQEDELKRRRSLRDPLTTFAPTLQIENASTAEQARQRHEFGMYANERRRRFSLR